MSPNFSKEHTQVFRGGGTGEASEATASLEFRGFTTEKFLASWIYERGNFSCFTGKQLVPPPLDPSNDFQVKEGPSLNISRVNPSCSKMKIHGKIFLVVAGGSNYHGNAGDTVELLDTTCPEQGWKMGMKYYFS